MGLRPGLDPRGDFFIRCAGRDELLERLRIDPGELEEHAIHPVVIFVLAGGAVQHRSALIKHAPDNDVAREKGAGTARIILGQVEREMGKVLRHIVNLV